MSESITMEDENVRTIIDEYGILHQRRSSRGGWKDVKRELGDYTIDLQRRNTADYLDALKAAGVHLRMNEMSDRIEIEGLPLSDAMGAIILNRLRDMGLVGERRMADAILEAAYRNKYHPVCDYFKSLPKWDGVDRVEKMMSYFSFTPGRETAGRIFIRRWLIGCITKITRHEQTFMLVLDGPQGIGKSHWARWLAGDLPDYFLEGAIKPDDKDSFIRLISHWIWEVGELQATTRRADIEALKDFITRKMVTVRLPFARNDTHKPAAASLIGTINENGAGFLMDRTGNRRFAVASINDIDWSYTEIDRPQLWAQIVHLAEAGETSHLTPNEQKLQHEINEEYEVISSTVELFNSRYEIDPDATRPVRASAIIKQLKDDGLTGSQRGAMMEIAAYMASHGVKKEKTKGYIHYVGIKEVYNG